MKKQLLTLLTGFLITVTAVAGNCDYKISTTDETCSGSDGSATLTSLDSLSQYSVKWSNGAFGYTASGLTAGYYTITITGNNCTSYDTVVIANDTTNCGGNNTSKTCDAEFTTTVSSINSLDIHFHNLDSVNKNYNNEFTYWDFGDGTKSSALDWSPNHVYAKGGTYKVCLTVGIKDSTCNDSYCMSITVKDDTTGNTKCDLKAFASADSSNYCKIYGNTAGGTAPYAYKWNTGANTFSINASAAGTYTVTVTDAKGCTSSATIQKTAGTNCDSTNTTCDLKVTATADSTNCKVKSTAVGGTAPYTYNWNTGDNTASITAANSGVYSVTVTDDKGCTATATVQKVAGTNCGGNTNQKYMIAGSVTANNAGVDNATVYLIKFANNELTAVDTLVITTTDSSWFSFYVEAGDYLVKAALNSGSVNYSKYLPTYYGGELLWKDASTITLNANSYNNNISLIAGNNPGGPGFIGGNVSQGANKKEGPGDPIANVPVLLLDGAGMPVAYTYSDAAGMFEFKNIAYGTYTVHAEMTGKYTEEGEVTIDATTPTVKGVEVKVNNNEITTVINVEGAKFSIGAVYPNPVADMASVNVKTLKAETVIVEVYNAVGQQIYRQDVQINTGVNQISVNTTKLNKGIYFLSVTSDDNQTQIMKRFMKTN